MGAESVVSPVRPLASCTYASHVCRGLTRGPVVRHPRLTERAGATTTSCPVRRSPFPRSRALAGACACVLALARAARRRADAPAAAATGSRSSPSSAPRSRARSGPSAYVALRTVWREWDRGDPAEVEEALREVATDPRASAPGARLRGAARGLRAPPPRGPRRRARAHRASLGYVGALDGRRPVRQRGQGRASIAPSAPRRSGCSRSTSPATTTARSAPVRWRVAPDVVPLRLARLRRLRAPEREGLRLRRRRSCATRARRADGKARASPTPRPISVWAGQRGRRARLLERRRGPPRRRSTATSTPTASRRR